MNLKEWLIMQKTINKIINNHEKEIKNELENLTHKGFIITPENEIYKFNIFDKMFYKMDPENFYNLFALSGNINYWNFTPEQNQNIINNLLFDKDNNIFPVITNQELKEFRLYLQANDFINSNQFISKRALNKALKENDNKKTKENIKFEFNNPYSQAQIIINNDVFMNEKNSLYKYDKTNNNFILLATHGYNKGLRDLFIKYSNERDKSRNNVKITNVYIEDIIKENLAFYKQKLVYFRCELYNKQIEQENNLNKCKTSYKKIKKVITNFD